jgi:hypothetical protein
MKKTNSIKFLGMIAVAAGLFLASCSKEGPAGAAGADGAAGSTGPAGPAGPSAKVFDYSFTYAVGDSLKSTTLTGSTATDVAVTYWKFSDGSMIQLPYGSYENTFYVINYFYPSTGVVEIEIPKRISTATSAIPFRSVLIKATAKVPFLDYSNYNAVKAFYNLKD